MKLMTKSSEPWSQKTEEIMANSVYCFTILLSERSDLNRYRNLSNRSLSMISDKRCKCWKCESEEGREEHF